MSIVNIKQHDTKGKFIDALTLSGVPVNLSGILGLRFLMKKLGEVVVSGTGVVTSASLGQVEYQPVADDVKNTGEFKQEWEVTFADNRILTFPNGDYNKVNILHDLG